MMQQRLGIEPSLRLLALCLLFGVSWRVADGFLASPVGEAAATARTATTSLFSEATTFSKKGFAQVPKRGAVAGNARVLEPIPVTVLKQELLDLIPSMTTTAEESLRRVEQLVNALEDGYVPPQTLGFLNLAMAGEWQLLFSTNLRGNQNPAKFRLRELYQIIEPDQRQGMITNQALWDLAQDQDQVFDAMGTFAVVCNYTIHQGARKTIQVLDHVLKPAFGSKIPTDVPALVGRLHRAMPKEMFDPNEHSMDTTYLDVNLRIVRMTGPRLEGVRGIFIRRGTLQIDPTNNNNSNSNQQRDDSAK
jgi:PAP_fibrillin